MGRIRSTEKYRRMMSELLKKRSKRMREKHRKEVLEREINDGKFIVLPEDDVEQLKLEGEKNEESM